MSIRVGKYNYKTKKQPITPGYTNVLIHTTGQLSPYEMKDSDGVIMENLHQFHKYWNEIPAIRQPVSQWHADTIRWEHPAEVHFENGQLTPAYWEWRQKGFQNERWIRYPVGYHKHKTAMGTVIGTPENYEIVGYIEARKRVYFTKYREIAIQTAQFKALKAKYDAGEHIQINEVDGPTFAEEYPYNQTVNGSMEMTEDILKALINNPKQAFGHGYTLAACLMDIDLNEEYNN